MNTTTIVRRYHRTTWLGAAGAWVIVATACGDNATNVLTPRDASIQADGSDDPRDVSVENSVEADTDASDASLETVVEAAVDVSSSDSADAIADQPGFDGTTGCRASGDLCTFAGHCCSLSCPLPDPRICVVGPLCTPAGGGCGSNADCCADRCDPGVCVGVTMGCQPAGEYCSSNSDCCGGRCDPLDGEKPRCALVPGCNGVGRALGEICVIESDCCSGKCGNDIQDIRRICVP